MFPKIVGFPPNHPLKNRVFNFHYFHHPFFGGVSPLIFGSTPNLMVTTPGGLSCRATKPPQVPPKGRSRPSRPRANSTAAEAAKGLAIFGGQPWGFSQLKMISIFGVWRLGGTHIPPIFKETHAHFWGMMNLSVR